MSHKSMLSWFCTLLQPGGRAFCTALLLGISLAYPVFSQTDILTQPDILSEAEITRLLDRGDALLEAGKLSEAFDILLKANDATYIRDDLSGLIKHRPNLSIARYYLATENYTEVIRFAASVTTALYDDVYLAHPIRIEAATLHGIALFKLEQYIEAELVLAGAYALSADKPELLRIYQLAEFYLTATAIELFAENAGELLDRFYDNYGPDHPISQAEVIHLVHRHIYVSFVEQADPIDETIIASETFLEQITDNGNVTDFTKSYYRGFHGVLLSQNERWEEALSIFYARQSFLSETEPFSHDYFENAQRLGIAAMKTDRTDAGMNFIVLILEESITEGAPASQIYTFERDLGRMHEHLGNIDTAQGFYRAAYTRLRSVRRANDADVLALAPYIDTNHPGILGFAFGDELGVTDGIVFDLYPDGRDVLRLFFEGRYIVLGSLLDRYDHDTSPLFLVNAALFGALTQKYDSSMDLIARGRIASRSPNQSGLTGDAIIFDLIDVVAKIWSSTHQIEKSQEALDRLELRQADMTQSERGMYLALKAYKMFRVERFAYLRDVVVAWQDYYDPDTPKTVWDIFTGMLVSELAFQVVSTAEAEQLQDDILNDLKAHPDLILARDYQRLAVLISGPFGLSNDDALAQVGILIRNISAQVPPGHPLIASVQFAMFQAYDLRGQTEQALEWLRKATIATRHDPYHALGMLAFLLSEQSRLLIAAGHTNPGAVIAREAYDMIDLETGRPGFAERVIVNFANATWSRTNDPVVAAAILQQHLDDPALFDRLAPSNKVDLLLTYAGYKTQFSPIEELRIIYSRAEVAITDDFTDFRALRSNILWFRAVAEYGAEEKAIAFEQMRMSNEINADWQSSLRASGGTDGNSGNPAHLRATWEALIGWEYAQTLPD